MGFLTNTTAVSLTAKLTPYGRQQLLTNSSSIITKFSLGDSDANYQGDLTLTNGWVPDMAGEIGPNNTFSNGVFGSTNIRSLLVVNSIGDTKKLVQAGSNVVTITPILNGLRSASGTSLTQLIIDRTLGDTDSNTNLFKSFGLPITQTEKDKFTLFNDPNGYLNTAIRNLNQNKVLVIAIDTCLYGEMLDGKAINIELEVSDGPSLTYSIYSSFQKSLTPLTTIDTQLKEKQSMSYMGNNVALLFSDERQKPNNDATKSWSTGFGLTKPFSLNSKERFNHIANATTLSNVDTAIGVAYLDKGIIVITDPLIVDFYDTSSGSTTNVRFNSVSNEVAQNITCIVERDEFATTMNSTHTDGELLRVSEVALYDNSNNVIAYAKSNEQILIGANQFMALGVKILV